MNSEPRPLRVAIIDIGSASIRCVAVEVDAKGERRMLAEDRAMTKLARSLASTGMLAPEAIEPSLEAIARFVERARQLSCTVVRAFATSAVREARNGGEFVRAVREATGRAGCAVEVEIVSEEEEGLLALRSATSRVDMASSRVGVADLGGGSLEVVLADRGVVWLNRSLPLGAVRLTDQFGGAMACSGARFAEMERHVRGVLGDAVLPNAIVERLVASGGTLTTLAAMARAMRRREGGRGAAVAVEWSVHGADVVHFLERIRGTPMGYRHEIPGLPGDRVDIIVAGLVVVRELMARVGVDALVVNPAGLREGLILRVIDQTRGGSSRAESAIDGGLG